MDLVYHPGSFFTPRQIRLIFLNLTFSISFAIQVLPDHFSPVNSTVQSYNWEEQYLMNFELCRPND